MEKAMTSPISRPMTLLNLPAEIKNRIYEEVFKGSEMQLNIVGHRDGRALFRCTCPEDTRILRTC